MREVSSVSVTGLKSWEEYKEGRTEIIAIPAQHMAGHCLGYLVKLFNECSLGTVNFP